MKLSWKIPEWRWDLYNHSTKLRTSEFSMLSVYIKSFTKTFYLYCEICQATLQELSISILTLTFWLLKMVHGKSDTGNLTGSWRPILNLCSFTFQVWVLGTFLLLLAHSDARIEATKAKMETEQPFPFWLKPDNCVRRTAFRFTVAYAPWLTTSFGLDLCVTMLRIRSKQSYYDNITKNNLRKLFTCTNTSYNQQTNIDGVASQRNLRQSQIFGPSSFALVGGSFLNSLKHWFWPFWQIRVQLYLRLGVP